MLGGVTSQAPEHDVGGGGRSARVRSLALVAVFVAGFVLVSSVVVVRSRLLSTAFYTEALAGNEAYERAYTEVLADPELTELTKQVLGGFDLDALDPTQVQELTTRALRRSIPPATMRRGTETAIATILAYVRGETARLDVDVNVSDVLERIADKAVAWVDTLLAAAEDRVTTSIDDYSTAVASFLDRIGSGRVPDRLPVLGGATVDRGLVAGTILDELGPDVDRELRDQVEAAVLAGDQRDALITAAHDRVADRSAQAVSDLRASLEDRRELDVVTELADRAGRSKAAVVDRLDVVRDAARWFGPATGVVGVLLMVAAAVGVLWLHRRRLRHSGLVMAVAAVVAGLTVLILWAVVTVLVDAPLAPATGTGPDSWGLPPGLRSLLADVVSTLDEELTRTVWWLALVPVALGAALAVGIAAAARFRRLRPTG